VSETELHDAVQKAEERWGTERTPEPKLLAAMDRYIALLPLPTFPDGAEAPEVLPSDSACLSHTRREGGTAAGLEELYTAYLCGSLDCVNEDGFIEPTYAGRLMGPLSDEEVVAAFERFDILADITEGTPKIPPSALIRRLATSKLPALRPHPIEEMGGKIRVVTLHRAEEAQAARELTATWLRALKGLLTTRDALKGKPVQLSARTEKAKLYSADLSAATDYIPHSLAQHTARLLCKAINREQDIPLAEHLLGPQTLPDGTVTKNGIHMGLGCSWPILCLINSFAAWYAGADRRSYQVCGDDLIGLWPKPVRLRYESTLEGLGLVVNKSKSFFGRRGVFCEQIVTKLSSTTAKSADVGHLSALTAGKLVSGRSTSTLAVADQLLSTKDWSGTASRTTQALLPRRNVPGRIRSYGTGAPADKRTIAALLKGGAAPLTVSDEHLPQKTREDLRLLEAETGEIPVSDFLVELQTALRVGRNLRGLPSPKVRYTSVGEHLRASRAKRPKKDPSLADLRGLVQRSELSSKNRKVALYLLSETRYHASLSTRLHRLECVVLKGRRERFLPLQTCEDWIREASKMEWGNKLRRNPRLPKALGTAATRLDWSAHHARQAGAGTL